MFMGMDMYLLVGGLLVLAGLYQLWGGATLTPEFVALLMALSLYTAAFIAEIVRSGIMSVSHGQTEASRADREPHRRQKERDSEEPTPGNGRQH